MAGAKGLITQAVSFLQQQQVIPLQVLETKRGQVLQTMPCRTGKRKRLKKEWGRGQSIGRRRQGQQCGVQRANQQSADEGCRLLLRQQKARTRVLLARA